MAQPINGNLLLQNRIDAICDLFESAWRRGENPDLAPYLAQFQGLDQRPLFSALLELDLEYRRQAGMQPSIETYRRAYPQFASEIEEVAFKESLESTGPASDAAVASPSAPPTRRFMRFELIERIGSGASGEVWKARDPRLNRLVALKLPQSQHQQEEELHRFLREARAAAQLRHPNIVRVLEAGRECGSIYIAAELIEGGNLRLRLQACRYAPRAAAELCATLAEAVDYAHRCGVIHRDLKPANIIIDNAGAPHIADFGLAKLAADSRDLTLQGQLLGTPAYMAPEQARGAGQAVDARSDVYALGAILYELLVGRPPFEGNPSEVLRAVIADQPRAPRRLLRAIPRDLETVCLKALEKEPDRRYETAQEVAVDLRRFLRGETILAGRAGPVRKCWRYLRRRPSILAIGLLLFAAVASAAYAVRTEQRSREKLGYRTIVLETNPPQAKVAFVPLSKSTGEPEIGRMIAGESASPVRQELLPGKYLVVAILSDGRFHEVLRQIPARGELFNLGHNHRRVKMLNDGSLRLAPIEIPSLDVTDGMALIEGGKAFVMGGASVDDFTRRAVQSFYMAPREFTVGDFFRLKGFYPKGKDQSSADEAFSADYDLAVACAEDLGLRLPTEAEYEYAATDGGRRRYPWGDSFPDETPRAAATFFTAPFDQLPTQPAVLGLCSNKAEWTCSLPVSILDFPVSPGPLGIEDVRIVKGGDSTVVGGTPTVTADTRDPRARTLVPRNKTASGVGFRCVRSARPLVRYEALP